MTAWTPQPNSPSPRQLQSHSCGQWLPETFKMNNIENHAPLWSVTQPQLIRQNVWTCTQLGKPTWHQCPLPPPYTSGWLWWPFQCKSSLSVLQTQTYQISAWWKKIPSNFMFSLFPRSSTAKNPNTKKQTKDLEVKCWTHTHSVHWIAQYEKVVVYRSTFTEFVLFSKNLWT